MLVSLIEFFAAILVLIILAPFSLVVVASAAAALGAVCLFVWGVCAAFANN